ncbi:BET1 homolog [Cydia fagiglandana]|uniref:BET1 homolog n=1 Tax=Cydia fagiglandana TaxID=1458189 RepID=UPI002FEDFB1A
MRRARDGYAYQPIPRVATEDAVAHENDQMAEELSGKISTLKHMSIEIGNEVRYQDKILRGLDDDVDRSSGFLGKTMGRVLRLGKGNHNYYVFYLFLFSIFVFFLLYIVLKFR